MPGRLENRPNGGRKAGFNMVGRDDATSAGAESMTPRGTDGVCRVPTVPSLSLEPAALASGTRGRWGPPVSSPMSSDRSSKSAAGRADDLAPL